MTGVFNFIKLILHFWNGRLQSLWLLALSVSQGQATATVWLWHTLSHGIHFFSSNSKDFHQDSITHPKGNHFKLNGALAWSRFSTVTERKKSKDMLRTQLFSLSLCLISLPSSISIASVIEERRLPSVVTKTAIGVLGSVPAAGVWQENECKTIWGQVHAFSFNNAADNLSWCLYWYMGDVCCEMFFIWCV